MRFIRLHPIKVQFNIIKRMFCHHNNMSDATPKNVNVVSRLNTIDAKINDIDAKMNDIDTKIKNMDSIMFSIFCLWNGLYFPVILYFSN
jgi:hypothetical protein